jgi:hypothetical protein
MVVSVLKHLEIHKVIFIINIHMILAFAFWIVGASVGLFIMRAALAIDGAPSHNGGCGDGR